MTEGRPNKLGKLIRLLSSDQPGEAAAAAAALNRALLADGLDIHALAQVVERSSLVPSEKPQDDPPSDMSDAWKETRGFCARHRDLLSERDRAFIESLATWRGRPTEKQLQWLLDIEAKARWKKQQ